MSTKPTMTRRFFAKAAAGVSAAIATASTAGTALSQTVIHKVLRRPHVQIRTCAGRPYMLFDCLELRADLRAPLRVKAEIDGTDEPVLELTVVPRNGQTIRLLGVHSTRAEWPLKVTLSSKQPFILRQFHTVYMNPACRRVDGMIVYNDPFYKPRPDGVGVCVQDARIKRTLKAEDVHYGKS